MASMMIYLVALSAVVLLALRLVEQAGWLFRQPTRLVWLIGAWSLVGFTLLQTVTRRAAPAIARSSTVSSDFSVTDGASHPPASLVSQLPELLTARTWGRFRVSSDVLPAWTRALDAALLAFWFASSGLIAVGVGLSMLYTHTQRRQWASVELDQVPVLMSDRTGPAVVGVMRRRIVLPRWVFGLSLHERTLVLAHEQEHVRQADPVLTALMLLALILVPWNPVLWAMRSRLRLALEIDCDRRVLHAHAALSSYGALLLRVAERGCAGRIPSVMFSGRSDLRARMKRMLTDRPMHWAARWSRAGLFMLLSAVLVGGACVAPRPQPSSQPADHARQLAAQLIGALAADSATFARHRTAADRVSLQRHLERFVDTRSPSLSSSSLATGSPDDFLRRPAVTAVWQGLDTIADANDGLAEAAWFQSHDRLRTSATAVMRQREVRDRVAFLHERVNIAAGQLARIASVLRSDPRFVSGDNSALHGGRPGTLWIVASPNNVIVRSKSVPGRVDPDDIINAERISWEFPQILADDVSGVRVIGGSSVGVAYARVIWATVAR